MTGSVRWEQPDLGNLTCGPSEPFRVSHTHLSSWFLSAWMCKGTQTQRETQSVRVTPSRLWGQGYTSSPSHTHTHRLGGAAPAEWARCYFKVPGELRINCGAVRNGRGWIFELIVAAPGCQLVSFPTQNWFEAARLSPDLFLSVCLKHGVPYWIRQVIQFIHI